MPSNTNDYLDRNPSYHTQKQWENKNSADVLQAVLDTGLMCICLFEASRNQLGNIEDFIFMAVNKELERVTNRTDLVGKLYAAEYPGVKEIGLFDIMLSVMETGIQSQTEYFYPYQGYNKWFSCTFVKSNDGLVMAAVDISRVKQAEEDKLKLISKQHKDLLLATLNIQEIERKRISDGLHNGVGQLLFGIKLILTQPIDEDNLNLKEINALRFDTAELVEQAITETRNLSHELTPIILEQYGLKGAMQSICNQFKNTLDFNCMFTGTTKRLNKDLEIVIYRIAQELVLNVVKHAMATSASLTTRIDRSMIIVIVEDNGIGFNINLNNSNGIGLKTIKSRVNILNGSFDLHSNPGTANTVTIKVPYENGLYS